LNREVGDPPSANEAAKEREEGKAMPTRPFWKGYLKLSLVTCPVAMTPATTEKEKVRFHVLNRRTGNRVVSRYLDSSDGAPVEEDDLVKGYRRGEDDFVLVEDEELESVALESARTIDIERFAPADSIDDIWCDRAHYLTPDDQVGEEAFAVIRDAMKATAVVGLSRLVLYRRERPVMLKPRDNGLVVWTLRYGDEVRDETDLFGESGAVKADPEALDLVAQLIEKLTTRWDSKLARDPTQEKLLELIASKRKGRKRLTKKAADEPQAQTGNVINIMEALRKSLRSESPSAKSR
jgi:DNA end-binding protein Ku